LTISTPYAEVSLQAGETSALTVLLCLVRVFAVTGEAEEDVVISTRGTSCILWNHHFGVFAGSCWPPWDFSCPFPGSFGTGWTLLPAVIAAASAHPALLKLLPGELITARALILRGFWAERWSTCL